MKKGIVIALIVLVIGVMGFSTYIYFTEKDNYNANNNDTSGNNQNNNDEDNTNNDDDNQDNVIDKEKEASKLLFSQYITSIEEAENNLKLANKEYESDINKLEIVFEPKDKVANFNATIDTNGKVGNATAFVNAYTCTYNSFIGAECTK